MILHHILSISEIKNEIKKFHSKHKDKKFIKILAKCRSCNFIILYTQKTFTEQQWIEIKNHLNPYHNEIDIRTFYESR